MHLILSRPSDQIRDEIHFKLVAISSNYKCRGNLRECSTISLRLTNVLVTTNGRPHLVNVAIGTTGPLTFSGNNSREGIIYR
jgi:hypothetical protein